MHISHSAIPIVMIVKRFLCKISSTFIISCTQASVEIDKSLKQYDNFMKHSLVTVVRI